MRSRPDLVVEIGVRDGSSTGVFCEAARGFGGTVVSVDIEHTVFDTDYERWHFFREPSQELAKRFGDVQRRLAVGAVDVLFLDSSHVYEDTVEELRLWVPYLAPNGLIICHDTAMKRVYRAVDGTCRLGWDNERGVTQALEDVLGISLDEGRNYVQEQGDWVINHHPLSSGLTMLVRRGLEGGS